jgi:hypothetical protein
MAHGRDAHAPPLCPGPESLPQAVRAALVLCPMAVTNACRCPVGGPAPWGRPLSRVGTWVPRSFCLSDSGRCCAFGAGALPSRRQLLPVSPAAPKPSWDYKPGRRACQVNWPALLAASIGRPRRPSVRSRDCSDRRCNNSMRPNPINPSDAGVATDRASQVSSTAFIRIRPQVRCRANQPLSDSAAPPPRAFRRSGSCGSRPRCSPWRRRPSARRAGGPSDCCCR